MRPISVTLLKDREATPGKLHLTLQAQRCRVRQVCLAGRTSDDLQDLERSVLVLDLGVTEETVLRWCRDLRAAYPANPILVLAGETEPWEEAVALELGADAVLAGPVGSRRIAAQIHALGRWLDHDSGDGAPDLTIDPDSREAALGGVPVHLTSAEYDLLSLLWSRSGRVVSREEISENLRGIPYDGLNRAIDLRVARLRRKLGDDAVNPRFIRAVRGEGYMVTSRVHR